MNSEMNNLDRELQLDTDTNSDSENEEYTPEGVLKILEDAWLNEKFSPEILPHKIEFVDCMLEQIKHIESNISSLPKNDLKVDILKIELERIRYIITSYLRCRLRKIELYAFYITEQESTRIPEERYLSNSELKFAVEYIRNLDNNFEIVLKEMPSHLRTLANSNKRIKPDMDSYVFLRSNKSIPTIIITDVFENRDEKVDLTENSQHLVPYSSISSLVKDGSVQLI